MTNVITKKESDLIRMKNGKKDLPEGITLTRNKTYRLQRRINGKKYDFPVIRNLELALKMNKSVDGMANDMREISAENKALKNEVSSTLIDVDVEPVQVDVDLSAELASINYNLQTVINLTMSVYDNQNKSFLRRLFNL